MPRSFRFIFFLFILMLLGGCISSERSLPTPAQDLPTAVLITPTYPPTQVDGITPQPQNITPTPTEPLAQDTCQQGTQIVDGHFVLKRPIGPDGNQHVDKTYRYGQTQNGGLIPHSGVEFRNLTGTPVLAAQGGEVVFAGEDYEEVLGKFQGFYGKVIVIQHDDLVEDTSLYTLYAHLSQINVQVGQRVKVGEKIGEVGLSGIANGSHLHFEVRLGENTYTAVRNPELWMEPHQDDDEQSSGALVGMAFGSQTLLPVDEFMLRIDEERRFIETYSIITNPDDLYGEQFGIAELPPGIYDLSFTYNDALYRQTIQIMSGQLTIAAFCLGK